MEPIRQDLASEPEPEEDNNLAVTIFGKEYEGRSNGERTIDGSADDCEAGRIAPTGPQLASVFFFFAMIF